MEKTLVIYESRYGTAQAYAKTIADKLDAGIVSAKSLREDDLEDVKTVVIGGSIYISKLKVLKRLKRFEAILKDKRLFFFAVGLSDEASDDVLEKIRNDNPALAMVKEENQYYFPGYFDVKTLNLRHRLLMKMLHAMLRKKEDRSAEEEGLLNAIENPVDYRDMSLVDPLVKRVRET